MTTPNRMSGPTDTANRTSLREFSEKSAEDWKKGTYGDVMGHFNFDFLKLGQGVGNLFIRVVAGLFGGYVSEDPIGDFISQFNRKVTEPIAQHTAAIEKLSQVRAVSTLSPAWQAMGAEDMSTIPRNLVVAQPVAKEEVVTTSNSNPSYRRDRIVYEVPMLEPKQKTVLFAPILVKREGVIDKLKVLTGATPAKWIISSSDVWNVGLYALDQVGFTLSLIWDSGNIASQLIDQTTEYEIDIAIKQRCKPGQILFAAQRQDITQGVLKLTRAVYGTNQAPVRTGSLIYSCVYSLPDALAFPQQITLGELNPDLRFVPWMAVTTKPIGAPS